MRKKTAQIHHGMDGDVSHFAHSLRIFVFIYYFALHHISMGVIDDGNDEDDGAHD